MRVATHTKTIGDRTEARVLAALVERFPVVLLPWGENHRFDLVVQTIDGEYLRVQCKTSRLRSGAVVFNTVSFTYHHPANMAREDRTTQHWSTGYEGQADVFGVYCPETRETYLVPVAEAPGRQCRLRVTPSRNGQRAGIRWAADFRIDGPDVPPE